jgi:UDP-N-acetylglucosamine 2-epimerase (non-hydrolysing)
MKILVVFGTRPEAIKLAPVIAELKLLHPRVETKVVLTAQHRDLVDPILNFFGIIPDFDLDIMEKAQTPSDVTVRVLEKMQPLYGKEKPDHVLVQGDTTSGMAAALGAFFEKIPVAHVEAGLRTDDRYNPFPEEMNRRLISQIASLHFAATSSNRENLLRENVAPDSIHVTGNPVIDALQQITARTDEFSPALDRIDRTKRIILLTTHRRENFGEPQRKIFEAVNSIVEEHSDVQIAFPVHPNPAVIESVGRYLHPHPRIALIEPLDYISFVQLMSLSHLILTDSGGVQEEAPALGKPVLVLRSTTERQEVIEAGSAMMVGVSKERIVDAVRDLLTQPDLYRKMSTPAYPFGRGDAAKKIVDILLKAR